MIDSGKGGLAFLNTIKKPNHNYILIMDSAYFPYGEKSKEFLIKRSIQLCTFLFNQGADIVILACNTLSLIALPFLREYFNGKVIGIFEQLIRFYSDKTMILCSARLSKELKKCGYLNVINSQELINAIEINQNVNKNISKTCSSLHPEIDTLILGCTHFLKVLDIFPKQYKLIYQNNIFI